MDKLELPSEVKSLEEYKQCIDKIYTWFTTNNRAVLGFTSDCKKQFDFVDAEYYFFIVVKELIGDLHPESETENFRVVSSMIFKNIINTLTLRLMGLDKQQETLDKDGGQK